MTDLLVTPLYPPFEGAHVDAAQLKIGAVPPVSDVVVHVDEVYEVIVQVKVIGVDHRVHKASGQLVRTQVAEVIDSRLVVP